ncbi:MAG: VOC family protein [Pseudoxanthomonas sp.]
MTQTVMPVLRMTDASRSLSFYVQGLGFAVDWEYRHAPGLPVFAQLTRQGQALCLTEHADDCQVGGAVYLTVPDVDACFSAFTATGWVQARAPQDMPWGAREFTVVDPDGNRLTFTRELAD